MRIPDHCHRFPIEDDDHVFPMITLIIVFYSVFSASILIVFSHIENGMSKHTKVTVCAPQGPKDHEQKSKLFVSSASGLPVSEGSVLCI